MFLLMPSGGGRAATARRGRLFAAALAGRLSRTGHQLPVDDRVRLAAAFEARAADRRVDGVRGRLLGVVVADRAVLAVRVGVARPPPSLALVPLATFQSLNSETLAPRTQSGLREGQGLNIRAFCGLSEHKVDGTKYVLVSYTASCACLRASL